MQPAKRIIQKNFNNRIQKCKSYEGLFIRDNGQNNQVTIDTPDVFVGTHIQIDANNTHIHIKNVRYIRYSKIFVYNGDNQRLTIGDGTSVEGMNVYLCGQDSSLEIAEDCMLANNIQIWTADGHSVVDKTSGEILNQKPGHVVVSKCTWIAQDAKLLKKAFIPANSIVGASSVVSRAFKEENTVIAGNPARVVKQNVIWNREVSNKSVKGYSSEKNDN